MATNIGIDFGFIGRDYYSIAIIDKKILDGVVD